MTPDSSSPIAAAVRRIRRTQPQQLLRADDHVGRRHRHGRADPPVGAVQRGADAVDGLLVAAQVAGPALLPHLGQLGEEGGGVRGRTRGVARVVQAFRDRPALGLGQVGEQQLGDGGDRDGDRAADPRVHADRVAALHLVDVDDLALLVDGQVHGVAGAFVERGQVRVGDAADVRVPRRPAGRARTAGRRAGSAGPAGGRPGRGRAAYAAAAARWTCARPAGSATCSRLRAPRRAAAGCSARGRRSGSRRHLVLSGPGPGPRSGSVQPGPSRSLPHARRPVPASASACARRAAARGRRARSVPAAASRWPCAEPVAQRQSAQGRRTGSRRRRRRPRPHGRRRPPPAPVRAPLGAGCYVDNIRIP